MLHRNRHIGTDFRRWFEGFLGLAHICSFQPNWRIYYIMLFWVLRGFCLFPIPVEQYALLILVIACVNLFVTVHETYLLFNLRRVRPWLGGSSCCPWRRGRRANSLLCPLTKPCEWCFLFSPSGYANEVASDTVWQSGLKRRYRVGAMRSYSPASSDARLTLI